ncbi:MAG: DNA polymerase I, partial [Bacteroidia bacterium]|nr:DNA polymerase I [Bacteroidia bacterium]
MSKKLFLLDAMALLYRAHFAFIKSPRITSKGENVSAVFGFTNTLLDLINREKPTHLAVAFDTVHPTFRHKQFENYKAQRPEIPEDLVKAIPYTHQMLEALNIPILEKDGYEADDIIGTIALQAKDLGFIVYMVTLDKDYAQLVQDGIYLYRPGSKDNEIEILDVSGVEKKYGLPPNKITDWLGLKGDASDNIPGIPKIGEKTALELLQQFSSLEEIIERSNIIQKKSIRESIKQHKEQGLFSKQLATIHTTVDIEWNEEDMRIGPPNIPKLRETLRELEFKTLASRLKISLTPEPQDLFSSPNDHANEFNSLINSTKTIHDVPHTYQIVTRIEDLQELADKLNSSKAFCLDCETTSLDTQEAEIAGLSFAIQPGEAWFVVLPTDKSDAIERLEILRPALENSSILKIGQNLKYDLLILANYGIQVKGKFFDTMLAHYVIDAESKHNMDFLAKQFLNYSPIPITNLIGKKGKQQLSIRQVELPRLAEYACEDADITLQLKEAMEPVLDRLCVKTVLETIEHPLLPVLVAMERAGVNIDIPALGQYSYELQQEMQAIEEQLFMLAGVSFNVNSPKQLGEIVFDKLKLGKAKKTPTGQYSTDEETLAELAKYHEFPVKVLEYRELAKLKSTYVDALPLLVNPKTGRIHTSFNQAVAATGRLSSTNPNLQNIPIRTEKGREIRKAFIPRQTNWKLLSADYSQIELRIMASLSGDENLIQAFIEKQDIHTSTAAKVFGVSPESVTPEMRRKAKTINFGIIYGITPFGLAQRLGISRTEAKEIIDSYFKQFPKVKSYMELSIQFARDHGYAQTITGRRRYLRDILSANSTVRAFAERNAINAPIQGSAADMIKLAMIRLYDELNKNKFQTQMILQVHDELLF